MNLVFYLGQKFCTHTKNLIAITEKDILNDIQFNYKLKLLQLCCTVSVQLLCTVSYYKI